MSYPEAIRALHEVVHAALRTAIRTEPDATGLALLWIAKEVDRLVDALPGHVTEN